MGYPFKHIYATSCENRCHFVIGSPWGNSPFADRKPGSQESSHHLLNTAQLGRDGPCVCSCSLLSSLRLTSIQEVGHRTQLIRVLAHKHKAKFSSHSTIKPAWWHMPIISTLGRKRQENLTLKLNMQRERPAFRHIFSIAILEAGQG